MTRVLYTFHTYCSWLADHPNGFVDSMDQGALPQNSGLGIYQRNQAKGNEVRLDSQHYVVMHQILAESATRRSFQIEAYVMHPTHMHLLIATDNPDARKLGSSLKRDLSYGLTKALGKPEVRWWGKNFHYRYVNQEEHRDELIQSYLPEHASDKVKVYISRKSS